MTQEEIEESRLEIERERLKIEREKAAADKNSLIKNLGTVITTIISLAAILVSISQVWVAYISKDKELKVQQEQKIQEATVLQAQQDRDWNLNVAKFVSEHEDAIFGEIRSEEHA